MSVDSDLTDLTEDLIEHVGEQVYYFPLHGSRTQIYAILERNTVEVETENGSVVTYDTLLHVKSSDTTDRTEQDEFEVDGTLYGVGRILGDEYGIKVLALVKR